MTAQPPHWQCTAIAFWTNNGLSALLPERVSTGWAQGSVADKPSKWIAVAVGTAIANRLPHRSVRARLRIRLVPAMNGAEALIGIRMQNTRLRNPPVEHWVETIPAYLRALTATD